MLPETLHDFLVASVGASASFIGLLFVALTLTLERSEESDIDRKDRHLAESSYTALITVLFISLAGLMPGGNITWVLAVMGVLGVLSSARLLRDQIMASKKAAFGIGVHVSFTLMYASIAAYGITLIAGATDLSLSLFYSIVFTLYGVALARAWALTGLGPGAKTTR